MSGRVLYNVGNIARSALEGWVVVKGKGRFRMGTIGLILGNMTVRAMAAQTAQIVFQEDRASVAAKYISSFVTVAWKDVFAWLTATGCVILAVWLAKHQKKPGQT